MFIQVLFSFLNWVVCLLFAVSLLFASSLYVLDINPLSDMRSADFGPLCRSPIHSIVPFAVWELSSLMQPHLSVLLLLPVLLVSYPKSHCQDQCREVFSPCSHLGLWVSGVTLKSLSHSELTFICDVSEIQVHLCSSVFPSPFIEETVLSTLCVLGTLVGN